MLTSALTNLISLVVVVLVALLMGFRSAAGTQAWLAVAAFPRNGGMVGRAGVEAPPGGQPCALTLADACPGHRAVIKPRGTVPDPYPAGSTSTTSPTTPPAVP